LLWMCTISNKTLKDFVSSYKHAQISDEIIIEIVNNAYEAVDMVENPPDKYTFIFMGCQIPILGGFDETRLIPIIAMTVNAM